MKEISAPSKIIKDSFNIFFEKDNLAFFLKIGLVSLLVSSLNLIPSQLNNFGKEMTPESFQYLFSNPLYWLPMCVLLIAVFILGLWSQASTYEAIKRVMDKKGLEFSETFKASWKYLWKFLLLNVLVGLVVVFGLVLLIIPGLIFAVWYGFALFGIPEGHGVKDSMRRSKEMVRGRFWKIVYRTAAFTVLIFIFTILLSIIPYGLGDLTSSLFGGLYLLPYYLLYRELKKA